MSPVVPVTMIDADPVAPAEAIAARVPQDDDSGGTRPPWAAGWVGADGRRPGDGRVARGARRAVRGRAVPGACGGAARRRHPVGRQFHARPRHGRLVAVDRPSHHRPLEPRRQRHRRRRLDGAGHRAAAPAAPTVLVIGDLSFLHDLNGLLAAQAATASTATIVADQQRRRRHLLVPAPGTVSIPAPAPELSSSCSARRRGRLRAGVSRLSAAHCQLADGMTSSA